MATSFTDRLSIGYEQIRRGRIRRRARPIVFYLALLLAGVMSVVFLPELLVNLVTGWTSEGAVLGIHRFHIMGIAGVVSAFLLGLFAQVYHPRHNVAAIWGALAIILTVSIGTVAFGVGRPEEVLPFLAVTAIAFTTHPAGRGLLGRSRALSPTLLTLVVIAAVPTAVYIGHQLTLTTTVGDSHAAMGHYVMMIGLAVAPLAYGVVAAVGVTGWRLTAWFAGIPMAFFGTLSIAFPLQSGSVGVAWGGAAIAWAIVFIVSTEYVQRQSASGESPI